MEYFVPRVHEGYEWVTFPTEGDSEQAALLGTDDPWITPHAELLSADSGTQLRAASLPWVGSYAIGMRDSAIERLPPVLIGSGAIGNMTCLTARLAMFSASRIHGALDEDRSEVLRGPSGSWMGVTTPVFRVEVVAHHAAFRLSEQRRGKLYIREDLVDSILASGDTSGSSFSHAGSAI